MKSTDAPSRTASKIAFHTLIISAASLFFDYMAYAMMVPLTPVSPANIHCTADESIIVFAYSVGLLVAAVNIKRLCRRLSHRSQMVAATSTLVCALSLIGSATHLSIYILGRLLQGAAAAMTSIVGFAAVARAFPTQRVRMLGVVLAAGSAGFIIGPVFGGLLFGLGGYRLPFLCFGLPLAILGLAQWHFLRSDGDPPAQITQLGLLDVGVIDGAKHGCLSTARGSRRMATAAAQSLPLMRSISVPALLAALCAASWATLEALVPLTLYQEYAQSPQAVGAVFSFNSLLAMLTNFLIIIFATKVTSSQLAVLGLALSCAIFVTLALIAHIYVLWLAVPLAGIAYSVLVNASTALFADRVDRTSTEGDVYQHAYAIFSIAYGIGYCIGSGVEFLCASFATFHSINLTLSCVFASLLPFVVTYRVRARSQ